MTTTLDLDLRCKICGQKAINVVELKGMRGFEYFCDKHINKDLRLRQEILEGKHG